MGFAVFLCNTDLLVLLGCWIREAESEEDRYIVESLFSQYLWMWIAASAMVVFYSIIYFVMRGWLIVDNHGIRWNKKRGSVRQTEPQYTLTEEEMMAKEIAHLMLL